MLFCDFFSDEQRSRRREAAALAEMTQALMQLELMSPGCVTDTMYFNDTMDHVPSDLGQGTIPELLRGGLEIEPRLGHRV